MTENTKAETPLQRLKHHVTGAIERGEKTPIVEQRVTDEGNAPRKLEVIKHDLPAYWASYLINGDDSGIEGKDQYEADKFLADHNLPSPVSCEPAGIGSFNGLMCDMETYSFLV